MRPSTQLLNFAIQSTFMETNEYLQQLTDIKAIIEKSTKFKALSGLSGVLAGLYALTGAFFAQSMVRHSTSVVYYDVLNLQFSADLLKLLALAMAILVLSIATGLYFSALHAKKNGARLWTPAAKRVLLNFSVPMAVGGIFIVSAIAKGYLDLVAPFCLSFYGLALLSASNYTFTETKYLGFVVLTLGCISLFFGGYGLYFWALGFGVFHIIYGAIMYNKYEK